MAIRISSLTLTAFVLAAALTTAQVPVTFKVAINYVDVSVRGVNDLAAVSIIGRGDAAQDLTRNRRLLLGAVDKFLGQQPPSATLEKIASYNREVGLGSIDPGGDVADPYLPERLANDRRTFGSLTR